MASHLALILMVVITCVLHPGVHGGKVLLLSMQRSGHLSEFAGLAEGLVARGHEVYMVLDEHLKVPSPFTGLEVTYLRYKSPKPEFMDAKKFDETGSELVLGPGGESAYLSYVKKHVNYDCLSLLRDADLLRRMKEEKFDYAVVDGMFFCYHIIPHNLGIPYGQLSSPLYSWMVRIHPLPGFVACGARGKKNTFINRLKLFAGSILFEKMVPNAFLDESDMLPFADPPVSSLRELAEKSSLYVINLNNVVDCPRPSMPNLIYVGGIAAKPPKPLSDDLKEYVDSAKDGFIVCTFGSMMAKAPRQVQEKLLKAFSMVKQKVIWRQAEIHSNVDVPSNVKPMAWLPQNDLLAHANVKVFITHCGNNGQQEAVYHGVPMLGMPLNGDQFENTNRAVELGYGLEASLKQDSAERIASLINELVGDPKYSNAVRKASMILKSGTPAKETAAYWVEHVMKYGGAHLRTTASDMNSIQFLMFDIYAFITVIIFIILFVVKKMACFLFRWLTSEKGPQKGASKKKTN